MSHQTGIEADEGLKSAIKKALEGHVRMLKVVIEGESLQMAKTTDPNSKWDEDFDESVLPVLEEKSACYIFYRLDDKDSHDNYRWLFMAFTPDDAPVRQKMTYSATKATIKKEFGGGVIKDEMFGTTKDDLSLSGYRKHLQSLEAPPPLSMAEQELLEVKEAEKQAMAGGSSRQSPIHGLSFPLVDDAREALKKMKSKALAYVQLEIDQKEENIKLARTEAVMSPADLKACVPDSTARYHFYLFNHKYQEDFFNSVVFIYSCPGFKSPVKERMLYSSCKNPVVDQVEALLGMQVDKKIEIDSGEDISEEFLMDEVHPKKTIVKPKFAKPKPPGRAASGNHR
jgi:twinfilin-like protein